MIFAPLYKHLFPGNGLYLQAVPPPMDNPSLPWKIVVGGPLPGAAERFRYTEEGYLYSHLMGEEIILLYDLRFCCGVARCLVVYYLYSHLMGERVG